MAAIGHGQLRSVVESLLTTGPGAGSQVIHGFLVGKSINGLFFGWENPSRNGGFLVGKMHLEMEALTGPSEFSMAFAHKTCHPKGKLQNGTTDEGNPSASKSSGSKEIKNPSPFHD